MDKILASAFPAASADLNLKPGDVDLWLVFSDKITIPDTVLLDAYLPLLNDTEKQKRQRFYFERHRLQYLLTRALVRTTLSRYESIPPAAWIFTTNEYGRPKIAPELKPQLRHNLRFNLSHTDGLIVCAVSNGGAIGIDVEYIGRQNRTADIAERFFSAAECADLRSLPVAMQHERFFDYWTLKESYIKARGMGLAIPLGQFSFHLGPNQPVRIAFDEEIDDDPDRWQFLQYRPAANHKMALCLGMGGITSDLNQTISTEKIQTRKVIPLLSEELIQLS